MWLFLVVFMVHDFEEIIMMRAWFRKNEGFIKTRFPRLSPRLLGPGSLSSPAFALAVLAEFIIFSILTLASVELDLYSLMAGMVILFTAHLLLHIGSFLLLRRYVPYILTSVLTIPYSIYALVRFNNAGHLIGWDTLAWTAIVLVIMGANLFIMFKVAERFDHWLERWSSVA